ncbi:uncharacterized protein LOC144949654 [Lampetra fluviatilis]
MFHTLSSLLFGTRSAAAVAASRDPSPVRTREEEEEDGWVVLELVRGVESTELVACDPRTSKQEESALERLGTSWCSDAGLRLVQPGGEMIISRPRAHPTPTIVPIFTTATTSSNDDEAGQHLRRRWLQQQQRGHVLALGPPPQLLPRHHQQHQQQHQQHHHKQQQQRRGSRARQRVALSALHQPCGRTFNF